MKKLLIAIVLFCTLFTTTNVSGETSSTNLTLKQEKIMIESKENSLFVTLNYNSWVSSSTNGWENYNNSGRYGRIRV